MTKNKIVSLKARNAAIGVIVSVARWLFLIAVGYVILYPLIYMLTTSFRARGDFSDITVIWVSKNFSVENFAVAFKALNYLKTFWDTFRTEIVAALIEVVTCSITAYGLSRFEFKEKKILTFLLIATILIPTQMLMIPNMMNMRYFDCLGILKFLGGLIGVELRPNLLNTVWAFYLPSIFSVGLKAGLFTFIYVQFFKGMPKELEEAASIDGAGPIKTFVTIVVPSSGVAFLTVTIFSIIWHWNDSYLSALYLSKDYPISVSLTRIYSAVNSLGYGDLDLATTGPVMAACLLTIFPVLLMYCILQKQFIKSIDRVGIVG